MRRTTTWRRRIPPAIWAALLEVLSIQSSPRRHARAHEEAESWCEFTFVYMYAAIRVHLCWNHVAPRFPGVVRGAAGMGHGGLHVVAWQKNLCCTVMSLPFVCYRRTLPGIGSSRTLSEGNPFNTIAAQSSHRGQHIFVAATCHTSSCQEFMCKLQRGLLEEDVFIEGAAR